MNEYYTVRQIAEILGVTKQTINIAIHGRPERNQPGILLAVKRKNRYVIAKADAEKFIEQYREQMLKSASSKRRRGRGRIPEVPRKLKGYWLVDEIAAALRRTKSFVLQQITTASGGSGLRAVKIGQTYLIENRDAKRFIKEWLDKTES